MLVGSTRTNRGHAGRRMIACGNAPSARIVLRIQQAVWPHLTLMPRFPQGDIAMCRRPCRQVLGRGASIALLFALAMVFAPASGAYAASKRGADTTVTITAFPPSIQVDATDNASTDRPSTDNADTPASDAPGARHPRTRIQIDDEEFDSVSGAMEKAPWVIGLIFVSVLLLFLTLVVLVVGI